MDNSNETTINEKDEKPTAKNPRFFGAIFNLLRKRLGVQSKEMADYLGEDNPDKIYDWTSSKQRPRRQKLPKIIEYFINCFDKRTNSELKSILLKHIWFYVKSSSLPQPEKESLLKIKNCKDLISECLIIAYDNNVPFTIPTDIKFEESNYPDSSEYNPKPQASLMTDTPKKKDNTLGLSPILSNWYLKRNNEMFSSKSIKKALQNSDSDRMQCFVVGPSGMGKSQMLSEYCNSESKEYDRVYWLRARNDWTLYADFRNILIDGAIAAENGRWAFGRFLEDVEDFFKKTKRKHSLFVFENIYSFDELKKYLPDNTKSSFIITLSQKLSQSIYIDRFNGEAAEEFIFNRTGNPCTDDMNKKTIKQIVKFLNYCPLALEQAGTYIKNTNCSFHEYLELLKKEKKEIEEKYKANGKWDTSKENECIAEDEIAVAITYKITSDKLNNNVMSSFLNICSLMSPCAIQEYIFNGAQDLLPYALSKVVGTTEFFQMVDEIASYSIIHYYSDNKTLYLNQLTQKAIRFSVLGSELTWFDYATDILCRNFNYNGEDNNGKLLDILLILLPHISNIIHEWNIYTNVNKREITRYSNKTKQVKEIYQKLIDMSITSNKIIKKIKDENNDTLMLSSLDI